MLQVNKIAILALSLTMFNSAFAQNAVELKQLVDSYTLNSNNAFYNRVLSPAMIPEPARNKTDRINLLNQGFSNELATVLSVFNNSSENKKAEAVLNTVNKIDDDIESKESVSLSFKVARPT